MIDIILKIDILVCTVINLLIAYYYFTERNKKIDKALTKLEEKLKSMEKEIHYEQELLLSKSLQKDIKNNNK